MWPVIGVPVLLAAFLLKPLEETRREEIPAAT
jgi:hypothetical protein